MNSLNQATPLLNKSITRSLAGLIILFNLIVLFSWYIHPGLIDMKPNTAICFILLGTGLCFRSILKTIAFLVFMIGLITAVEYFFHTNFTIESALERMPLFAALNFMIISVGYFLMAGEQPKQSLGQYFLLSSLLLPLLVIIGHLYSSLSLFSFEGLGGLPIETSMAFFLLSLITLLSNPTPGVMAIFNDKSSGGLLAKNLIPIAIILPIMLGYLRLLGESAGLYGMQVGVSLMAVSIILCFVPIIWIIAIRLSKMDAILSLTAQKADAANKAKSVFLATMSHELRTPLNAIIGYSEMMEGTAKKEGLEKYTKNLGKVIYSGKHLLLLLNDLLDLSKIEADKVEVFLEDISIKELVNDLDSMIRPSLEKHNNTFKVNIKTDGEIIMHTDILRARQALLNLLANADKFTVNGQITLDVTSHGSMIQFDVTDTGIGIPPEQLERLFQSFSQGDSSTTRQYGGTGLGLYLSKCFCELLGGTISVKSKVNEGTIFTIQLPQTTRITKY
ncbi:MAG TPA: HAMP domain-containing sensor histidine kinase [Gammaproteobacteria bacterium]|nr:HAMP domain-containing sensor histidine kinase [Gammaproteobacteria bacterium]